MGIFRITMNQMVSHTGWIVDDRPVYRTPGGRRTANWSVTSSSLRPEAEHRRRPAPTPPRGPRFAGWLEEPPSEQDTLEVRRGDVVPERRLVDRSKLGDREGRRRQSKADVGVRELGPEPLTAREDDLPMVEGKVRQVADWMPGRVVGHRRVDVLRDEAEVGGSEDPRARVAIGVAERDQLLQVRQLSDVDLRGQVAPDRVLERLAVIQVAAGQGPRSEEWLPCTLPEENLELALSHLQHDRECLMARRDRSGRLLH